MDRQWGKGQVCWCITPHQPWPKVEKGRITSAVFINTLRVKFGSRGGRTASVDYGDAYRTEWAAIIALQERMRFELQLLNHRLSDIPEEKKEVST